MNNKIKLLLLLIFFLPGSIVLDASENPVCYQPQQKEGPKVQPARIFKKLMNKNNLSVDKNNVVSSKLSPGAPEITYEDLLNAYKPENNLNYYYPEEDTVYQMDVGIIDYDNPQHWIMPDITLSDPDFGEGIPLSKSPYASDFSTATHCKKYTYYDPDEVFYEFYEFHEDSIKIIGVVNENYEDSTVEIDTTDFIVTLLDININTEFIVQDSIVLGNESWLLEQYIYPQGFGTLTTPDGDLQVLLLANDYLERKYVDGKFQYEKIAYYNIFISKEGHMLTVKLKDDAPLTGLTEIDFLEYLRIDKSTGIEEINNVLPDEYLLLQNYPNPFNPITTIEYQVPRYEHVVLKVYDLSGEEIITLVNEPKAPGNYEVQFDASNLASGVYFYRLQTASGFNTTKKLLLLK